MSEIENQFTDCVKSSWKLLVKQFGFKPGKIWKPKIGIFFFDCNIQSYKFILKVELSRFDREFRFTLEGPFDFEGVHQLMDDYQWPTYITPESFTNINEYWWNLNPLEELEIKFKSAFHVFEQNYPIWLKKRLSELKRFHPEVTLNS